MKKLHPIIITNLVIFGVFALLIISDMLGKKDGETAIIGGLGFLLQAGVNFIAGLAVAIFTRKGTSKYYLLSALVILLIGFSLCGVWAGTANLNLH